MGISGEIWEYIGEGTVLIGVVLEILCEQKLILRNDDKRRDRLEGLGGYVLIVGLAISLAALVSTNEYFSKTIADLNVKASQANDRATSNEKEAAALRLRAEELEEQLLENGPRDLLLYGRREDKFVEAIRPYGPQKVQVRICFVDRQETRDTAERLTAVFKSAGWTVSPHSPDWEESNCAFTKPYEPIGSGLWVGMPSLHPTARTKETAKKLVESFRPIPLAANPHQVMPYGVRSSPSRESIVQRYDAPDAIVVVVMPPSGTK